MISGRAFASLLERHGLDVATGVPCSLVEDLIAVLEADPARYVAATREDAAVGVAAGAWLGGRRPVVIMQNSGLGTSLNALASLSLMYGLPALLLVTWRGFGGTDAPEHILMGEISPRLLDLLGIPYRVLAADSVDRDVAWAAAEMEQRSAPVALLIPPGVVATGHARAESPARASGWRGGRGAPGSTPGDPTPAQYEPSGARGLGPAAAEASLPTDRGAEPGAARRDRTRSHVPEILVPSVSRLAALGAVVKCLGDEPLIHANGYVCRESFSLGDRPQNFYMIGSMGLASAIGLGVARARPERRVVVADGDGNLLMNLGILAMISAAAPPNLVHCVFDNEVYGSTGNQGSPSRAVRLDALAAASGYRTVAAATEPEAVTRAVRAALAADGPHFVLAKVTAEKADVPRIPHTPAAIRDRFRAAVLAG
ncbi:MAG: thiamine pyrophosphate-dependent enzyme [Candidatus Rokuibacteriota bacterium]